MTPDLNAEEETKQDTGLRCSRDDARRLVAPRIEKGDQLLATLSDAHSWDGYKRVKDQYFKWHQYNVSLLTKRMFDARGGSFEYSVAGYDIPTFSYAEGLLELELACHHLERDISSHVRALESIVERLEFYEEPAPEPATQRQAAPQSRKVFIIHGRNFEAALELQKFLEKELGLETVILRDEPEKGRTLIEKFEDVAPSCGFAFALFTPDDFVEKDKQVYAQARPNTLFELGWFCGRLDREHTCILLQGDTKLPSDLQGLSTLNFSKAVEEISNLVKKEVTAARLTK